MSEVRSEFPGLQPRSKIGHWQGMFPGLLVIAGFCLLGAGRLNRMHLFDPDSPYYVMMARSLAALQGYCRTDDVLHSPFSFRPPGLSILLAPVALAFPFDAIAAKCVVLACAVVLLGLVYLTAEDRSLSQSHAQRCDWSAVGVVLLVATSPYTLLLSTEVLSEVPFAALTLLLLRWLTPDSASPDPVPANNGALASVSQTVPTHASVPTLGRVTVVSLLLAFLPFVRTVGVVFVAAVGMWSLVRRARWIWLIPVVCALMATAAWSYRNSLVSQTTYSTVVAASVGSNGIVAFVVRAYLRATVYFGLLGELLLPGLQPGLPRYESVMIDGTTIPPVPRALVSLLTLVIFGVSLAGMFARRGRDGALAGLYLAAYLAALAVYPWTHERLAWPLVPMIWAFVPAGCRVIAARELFATVLPVRRMRRLLGLLGLALVGWQTHHSVRMVQANVELVRAGDRFYDEASPGYYYCDWSAAGTWLAVNSPADSHVLTVHADVGSTSQLPQEMYSFDASAMPELHRTLVQQSVDYLVVPGRALPFGFPWSVVGTDEAFVYEVVYERRHVAILSVRPREASDPAPSPRYPEHVAEALAQTESALRQRPNRFDLQLQRAYLLDEQGDLTNSLLILRSLVNRRLASPGLYVALGDALVRTNRGAEALPWLNRAVWLPEADLVIRQMGETIRRAKGQRPRDASRNND